MEKIRTIQIPKRKSAIRFVGYIDKKYKFIIRYHRGSSEKECELHEGFCIMNGKEYMLTPVQMQRFREVYHDFQRDYEMTVELANERNREFHSVTKDGNTIYFKRLLDFTYHFISEGANGDVQQHKMLIWEYFTVFDFFGLFETNMYPLKRDRENRVALLSDDFILFHTDDEYLNTEMRYICGKATQADIDYLNLVDGGKRFCNDREIYGTKDLIVTNVKRIEFTYRIGSRKYNVYFTMGSTALSALYWYDGEDALYVYSHLGLIEIRITSELRALINEKIDGLKDDYKTNRFYVSTTQDKN